MAAKDAQGQTRMKAAQEVIRQRVRSLPDTVIVSLLAFDANPRSCSPAVGTDAS
jgi:hypothetical protein